MQAVPGYDKNVFVNCPFDQEYAPLFHAIVFAVYSAGFKPRSALEIADSSELRMEKILRIIKECRYSIHDISRTELSVVTQLPRFNMPFELGLFIGAKAYGNTAQRLKRAIVLDREPFRYQQYLSDISGQDIEAHQGKVDQVIVRVRNWLKSLSKDHMTGASHFIQKYHEFRTDLPELCQKFKCLESELTFADLTAIMTEWLTLYQQ